jgi:AcrR family transcriptional regulator
VAVTKQAIVETSIAILNRDGIDGLSMRTIAKALDVKAAALYNHISGKQELFGAIVEQMCTAYVVPESKEDHMKYLMALCRAYRAMLLTVRDSTFAFENSVPNTPRRVEIIRLVGDALLTAGVTRKNLMTASNMMNNYVLSFVADEVRFRNRPPGAMRQFAEGLGSGERPLFISEQSFDEQFDYGLRVLFTGMKMAE